MLLAALAGAGTVAVRGYTAEQLATYCWASQGLIGVVLLWGWTDLSDRIRTGDVVTDLLRPVHPVTAYLAVDLGRAGFATLTRFVAPIVVGALAFDLYVPQRLATYPLFAVSAVLAVVVCFCFRFLVNATGYWLLDARGVNTLSAFATTLRRRPGLPDPLHAGLGGPDALGGHAVPVDAAGADGRAGRADRDWCRRPGWSPVRPRGRSCCCVACRLVQRRAERKLVIQGG